MHIRQVDIRLHVCNASLHAHHFTALDKGPVDDTYSNTLFDSMLIEILSFGEPGIEVVMMQLRWKS